MCYVRWSVIPPSSPREWAGGSTGGRRSRTMSAREEADLRTLKTGAGFEPQREIKRPDLL
jgi:hypothetical protein